jgi:hypothetical protein
MYAHAPWSSTAQNSVGQELDALAVEFSDHPVNLLVRRLVVGVHEAVGVAIQAVVVEDGSDLAA